MHLVKQSTRSSWTAISSFTDIPLGAFCSKFIGFCPDKIKEQVEFAKVATQLPNLHNLIMH